MKGFERKLTRSHNFVDEANEVRIEFFGPQGLISYQKIDLNPGSLV